ncbi:MAG TPA: hypothetical protein VFC51_01480 [Chloroflexota bacterium]|nr:hypothetical protein [Chloroflexota bacterium]
MTRWLRLRDRVIQASASAPLRFAALAYVGAGGLAAGLLLVALLMSSPSALHRGDASPTAETNGASVAKNASQAASVSASLAPPRSPGAPAEPEVASLLPDETVAAEPEATTDAGEEPSSGRVVEPEDAPSALNDRPAPADTANRPDGSAEGNDASTEAPAQEIEASPAPFPAAVPAAPAGPAPKPIIAAPAFGPLIAQPAANAAKGSTGGATASAKLPPRTVASPAAGKPGPIRAGGPKMAPEPAGAFLPPAPGTVTAPAQPAIAGEPAPDRGERGGGSARVAANGVEGQQAPRVGRGTVQVAVDSAKGAPSGPVPALFAASAALQSVHQSNESSLRVVQTNSEVRGGAAATGPTVPAMHGSGSIQATSAGRVGGSAGSPVVIRGTAAAAAQPVLMAPTNQTQLHSGAIVTTTSQSPVVQLAPRVTASGGRQEPPGAPAAPSRHAGGSRTIAPASK